MSPRSWSDLSTLPTITPRISSISSRADRLSIGDDGERLERRAGEPGRARRQLRALDGLGVLGPREDLPPAAELLQLDAVAVDVVVLAQLLERGLQLGGRRIRFEDGELLGRDRSCAGEQRGFKQLR